MTLKNDIGTLSMCLQLIEGKLTEDITSQFEYQISLKEDVRNLAEQIVDELFFNTRYMYLYLALIMITENPEVTVI